MSHSKSSLKKRIRTQLRGSRGASVVCKNNRVLSVSRVRKHKNVAAAKAAETKRYYSAKAKFGANKVRGAGHTKDFNRAKAKFRRRKPQRPRVVGVSGRELRRREDGGGSW